MTHTPGPWEIEWPRKGKSFAKISSPKGNWWEFIKVCVRVDGKDNEQGYANAALIASAPELKAENERFREWGGEALTAIQCGKYGSAAFLLRQALGISNLEDNWEEEIYPGHEGWDD